MSGRRLLRVAEHEAAHAVAAQKMGLPVAWVTIDPGYDEGVFFEAAVKIPDELVDPRRDCFAICVAMMAPSFLASHDAYEIGRAAALEHRLACQIATNNGIAWREAHQHSSELMSEHRGEYLALSRRLLAERTVRFP